MSRTVINPKSTGTIKLAISEAALTSDPTVATDQIYAFKVVPTANLADIPATFGVAKGQAAAASSFTLQVSLLQDWGAADSVSQFMHDHDGEIIWFEHNPAASGVPTCTGSCYAVAGGFGGEADQNWVDDLSLPMVGAPEYA